ncbi:ROK family protein [Thalassobacillus devorans]|uniref:ROK family protein n=1 Tax=Thalassobacillus devorans TaxID=279813 RepID=UPI00048FEF4E|nr:ROK family protein [Thalassobacillus devorans]
MLIAVFDIGGTSIKYGVVDRDGSFMEDGSFPTAAKQGGEAIIKKVINKSLEIKKIWKIDGISISTAGQINSENGVVVYATDTIPDYTGMDIRSRVGKATGLKVKVENDVNCTALGEYWKGAANDTENFLCLTIGTGIGGSLFLNGQLYSGSSHAAAEIGHLTLYPGGKPCTCGNDGCLERYASSSALEEMINESFGSKIKVIEFFEKLRYGDKQSEAVFNQWLDDLTTGLKSVVHVLNPELIVIGGGISAQGEFLLTHIKQSLFEKVMPNHRRKLDVRIAVHQNKANLLGAAYHYFAD